MCVEGSSSPATPPTIPPARLVGNSSRYVRRIAAVAPHAVFTRLLGCCGMEVAVLDAVESRLGERIRQAREEAGLSVSGLSTVVGMPIATIEAIEAIEAGGALPTSALERIAAATGRRVDFFLQPDDDTFDVLLRAGDGTTVGIRTAVDMLAKFTADYEFLISLEE